MNVSPQKHPNRSSSAASYERLRSAAIPLRLLPQTAAIGADGHMSIGGCDLTDLAAEFGTPLFVYDEQHLRSRCREAHAAFGGGAAYAAKAFICAAMARLVISENLGIDISSAGEMHTVLRAFDQSAANDVASRLVLHGVAKSVADLSRARRTGVGRIVVDSFDELDRLDRLRGADGTVPRILLRVTPGVRPDVHAYVSTGQPDSKFGFSIPSGAAAAAVERAAASVSVALVGLHCHIGSQMLDLKSLTGALDAIFDFAHPLFGQGGCAAGHLQELSMGGGLGVAYVESDHAPSITEWAAILNEHWAALSEKSGLEARLVAEPGRSIAASAAVTLYMVGALKRPQHGSPPYAVVDGGYGDNPRPMLYGSSYTAFMPSRAAEPRPQRVRIVGNCCESGDVLVPSAPMPGGLSVGDLVATPVTGAYGYSMGMPYHRIGRPAVVFVSNGEAQLVVRRESLDDVVALDVL